MKKIELFLIVVFISIFMYSSIGYAQEIEEILEMSLDDILNIKIEVSSNKAFTVFNTPSTVSVIDNNMIRQYGFRTVSEALNSVAGFAVYPTYHKRDLPSARGILQNQYANKVLILINGVPSWHSVTGEANIERIDINAVERIEVLKGPGSVLYGSNAYSGAVNIVLANTGNDRVETNIGMGDNHSYSSGGTVRANKNGFTYFVSGNIYDDKGLDYKWTDETGVTGHFNPFFKTRNIVFTGNNDSHSFLFNGTSSSQGFFGGGLAFEEGTGNPHETNGYLANYSFKSKLNDKTGLKTDLRYDWNQVDFSLNAEDNLHIQWTGRRISGDVILDYDLRDDLSIESGLDYDYRECLESKVYFVKEDQILTDMDMKGKTVYEFSGFSQMSYLKNSISALIGSRVTKNEYFGTNLSSRFTLVKSFNPKNSVKLIAGQSFRAPSIMEVHIKSHNDTRLGNKDLKPETSTSIEIAYLTSFNNFYFQVLGYHSEYDNKIIRYTTGDGIYIFGNGNMFSAKGLELESKYTNPGFLNAYLNYDYINGTDGDKDPSGHYNFKYIPSHTLRAGILKKLYGFDVAMTLNYWSKTLGAGGNLDPQHGINLNFGYSHRVSDLSINHSLSIKNITNRDILFPEYANRAGIVNTIPTELGYGRRIMYTMKIAKF